MRMEITEIANKRLSECVYVVCLRVCVFACMCQYVFLNTET